MSYLDDASLVMIPSGYKDGKLYSVKPSDGAGDFTFTRGSNLAATRVDEDGLIEKGRENLILQSNQFDTTWVTGGLSETSGQIGYDGSSDAWLVENIADGSRFMTQTGLGLGVATCSIYAKAGTTDWIYFNNGLGVSAYYDLTNGALGTTSGVIDANIESIGSGWYRCSMTASSMNEVRYYLADSDNSLPTSIGDNVYFQDAQVEQGLVATDYIETGATTAQAGILEDMPRLDYSGGTCPALLLEPQRTNLIGNSEYLESSYYGKTRCTIEDNSTTSPEGVINASKMTSTDALESYIQGDVTTTGTKMSWSFFAKKGDLDYCHGLVWSSPNGCRQWFNLSTGAVGGTTTFGSGYSVDSASIEDYGNGWYRCTMIVNCSAGTQGCRVNISSADTTIGSAVNSYGYFYGLQAEDASYPTSYIPTYGTSVTRGADSCSKTGVSSLIGQTEGTIYWEGIAQPNDNPILVQLIPSAAGNYTNTIYLEYVHSSTEFKVQAWDNGVKQVQINTGNVVAGQVYKLAFAYKANDFALYMNGTQIGTDTSGSVQSGLDMIGVGSLNGTTNAAFYGSEAKQVALFKTRLSNADLATLTTP